MPFACLVEMPEEFTGNIPELAQFIPTKHQFASLYVPNCLDGHHVSIVSGIVNSETLAGIILFDYWLCNRGRTRKNILLQEVAKESIIYGSLIMPKFSDRIVGRFPALKNCQLD